jgi:Ca2+-binding RTX toxin-like protein
MALLIAGSAPGGLDMSQASLEAYGALTPTLQLPGIFQGDYRALGDPSYIVQFHGTGLTYGGNGFINGGTVNRILEISNVQAVFDLTGLSIPATELVGYISNNDVAGAFGSMLSGADTLVGSESGDWLEGYGGGDYLGGQGGDDVLYGRGGDDTIHGDDGNDYIFGGEGDDILFGDAGDDAIDGGDGSDQIYGGDGNDTIWGNGGRDSLFGEGGDDILMGDAGGAGAGDVDYIDGGDGNDLISGGPGADGIFGQQGADIIDGGEGSDMIIGGPGPDIMLGSGPSAYRGDTEGGDLFVYTSMADGGDQIWGFDLRAGTNDGIDLRPLFDSLGYAGVNPRGDGFLAVTTSASPIDAQVWIDANGGGDSYSPLVTLYGVAPATLTDAFFLFQ